MQAQRQGARAAITHKQNGRWEDVSWSTIQDEVKKLSAGLVGMGVKPGDRVAIFGGTSLQWLVVDLAITAARAVTVPIYASNTPDECRYILNNSEASLLFVDNDVQEGKQPGRASRIRQRIGECASVRKVVLFEGTPQGDREMALAGLLEQGKKAHEADAAAFDARLSAMKRDDLQCLIYTSGTTGDPKGVMLTHGNWVFEGEGLSELQLLLPTDAVMLFLPLAHSFAQVIKTGWLSQGFRLVIAESVDKLVANLGETSPTLLPSVPRVFEKVFANVVSNGMAAPGVKGKLFRWAFRLFDEYVDAKSQGKEYSSVSFALAKRLVFSKVKVALSQRLGGKMRLFISGGAPLSRKIAYFFDLLGFIVAEGYGLTETAAGSTINRAEKIKIGTVGRPLPGVEVKIAPDGEIMIKGQHVMKGYYKNEAATAEALDPDGWFHSGDIGEIDADGYLRITDRKKDIIVTAGGKNVAPQNLENLLKTYPMVSQAMVSGDKRKYLVVLICVNEENARKLLQEKGITPPASYAELSEHAEVKAAVQKTLDQVNAEQPPYQTLKKFRMMDHDFTQESGELTPTLKVKRKLCSQKYKAMLDGMYEGDLAD
ncbi:MAG TPA: long-chain fatty acid--CoA ligase [Myxococcaceae bacterium]